MDRPAYHQNDPFPDGMGIPHQAVEGFLAPLLSENLSPVFYRPTRLRVDSAWYGHIPFAHWIVSVSRPRLLVELGSHAGVSYAAFCEAVLRGQLDTQCFAVDTWEGDEHAGFYGNEIYTDLKAFHDARYAGFSELLRCRFDDALAYFEDASVDLLHVDGRHHYDDVRHDFETWRPKLSSRAIVLFHDINVRERDFGVWRLWAELRREAPGFEFWHGHGLGVLAFGAEAPESVRSLCKLEDTASVAALRERFAVLGERWVVDFELDQAQRAAEANAARAEEVQRRAEELQKLINRQHEQLTEVIPLASAQAALRVELASTRLDRLKIERNAAAHLAEAAQKASAAEQRIQDLLHERELIRRSLSWRVTRPLRYVRGLMAARRATPTVQESKQSTNGVAPSDHGSSHAAGSPKAEPRRRKILFASGEPHTPGHLYRSIRLASLAQDQGWDASWLPLPEIGPPPLIGVDVVVLWRAEYSEHVQGIVDLVHNQGGRVVFDIDDLVFKPEMANSEMLDSVRIGTFSENGALALFRRFQETLNRCDLCLCTTEEIAAQLRRTAKPTWIVPNGFDDLGHRAARLARRAVRLGGPSGLVRIGYAAGSRTHQKDFEVAVSALVAVLRARSHVRLVLFRDGSSGEGVILLREFPELAPCAEQIEWRDMVPVAELPAEMARFDINIAPLESGNPFCEAKSELKFFESALVNVPTVASPSGPFTRAIRDGETGFLAADAPQWESLLLRLTDDSELRRRVGRDAYHDVLWQFGPRRRGEMLAGFLAQAAGDSADSAIAFERDLRRGEYRARGVPKVVDAEVLFAADQLREAEVTVTIASYNYSEHIIEALDSVRLQTLDLLDLVVVDDVSPDDSVEVVLQWARTHAHRFNRLTVLRHRVNAGLGASRNSGFNEAETPFVLPLDSDNRLRPTCCATLLEVLKRSRAAYAYPQLQHFGASDDVTGGERFEPSRLIGGNFIDAMALVAKWAWAAAGGYYQDRSALGWEDYDLWCSLAELGQWGEPVAEILAEYRVHPGSMVNAITETAQTKRRVVETVEQRHHWLQITGRLPVQR